ncbi:MAG: hypothetical protein J7L61_03000, partial [Thermoplasmata archaeon]|nr:hypothetical protein [Thermoplasmata archaeon]
PPGTMPTCESMGVLNTLPAIIGALEATLALKMVVGERHRNLLFHINPWTMEWREIPITKDPNCPTCGRGEYPFLEARERPIATTFCEGNRVQITPTHRGEGIARTIAERYGAELRDGAAVLSVEGLEMVVFDDGRAIITGTGDEKEAQSLYARYVGW